MKTIPLFIAILVLLGTGFQAVPNADANPCVRAPSVCESHQNTEDQETTADSTT